MTLAWRQWFGWRPEVSCETVVLLVSVYFALACNGAFWQAAMAPHPDSIRVVFSLLLMLIGTHALLLGLLVWRWNMRVACSLLLLVGTLAAHYMDRYHIYLDVDMLRNVLATDVKEGGELITPSLLWPLLLVAVPIVLACRVRLRSDGWLRGSGRRMALLLLAAVSTLGGALLALQDVSSLMRNHREVRYLATPGNILIGLPRALRSERQVRRAAKLPIGIDAVATPRASGSRPRLLVIVMGETVRAQSWGLNGGRDTTPELARMDVVNFPDMHACGTSTEVSLPCLFSPWGRHDYDQKKIRAHQSLLHVLERVGISTLWRDNQSGCKGVCEGLPFQSLAATYTPELCGNGRCMDEILLQDLHIQVRGRDGDRVVVLHQLGNHGPAYFERYPPRFRRFTPTCDTRDIGRCTQEQIVNSYDNAVLYTDHFLARTLETLQAMEDYDTAMIYLSDHGESLGEKGLYLHGIPWAIAPAEQTRVPMTMWFSPGFVASRQLDLQCLHRRATDRTDHDNLFSSVLGLMQVHTALYQRGYDVFAGCAP